MGLTESRSGGAELHFEGRRIGGVGAAMPAPFLAQLRDLVGGDRIIGQDTHPAAPALLARGPAEPKRGPGTKQAARVDRALVPAHLS